MQTLEATEENLDKNIRRLAIPAAAENLLHLMVFIVDVIMVGRLGTEAIAAVGMAGAVNFVLTMVFSSSSAGTVSLVARYCGAKDKPTAERVAAQSMLLALVLGLCIAPLLYLSAVNILYLMSVEPDVATLGAVYFRIVICFLPFRLIMLAGHAAFRGAGDTRTPMLITLVMNCLNVLFNWLLIQARQAAATIEQAAVEKIRAFATGLEDEFSESQHAALQRELDELLLIGCHAKKPASRQRRTPARW